MGSKGLEFSVSVELISCSVTCSVKGKCLVNFNVSNVSLVESFNDVICETDWVRITLAVVGTYWRELNSNSVSGEHFQKLIECFEKESGSVLN